MTYFREVNYFAKHLHICVVLVGIYFKKPKNKNKQTPEMATGHKTCINQKKTASVEIQFKVETLSKFSDESQCLHLQNKGFGLRLYLTL